MTAPNPVIYSEYMTIHGSRAYGLNNPNSDWDYRGFFLPSAEHLLGFIGGPEQRQHQDPTRDVVSWDIRKFFRLASSCNPNVIEILFTEPSDQVQVGPYAKDILAMRHLFLSQKARDSFGGYAVSQLKKIKTADWKDPGTLKDAMHLMRLIVFGQQILQTGDLTVRFGADSMWHDTLTSIRAGHYPRQDVIRWAELGLTKMDEYAFRSPLPSEPDLHTLNGILVEILQRHVKATT